MLKKHKQFINSCIFGIDLFAVSISWILSYFVRFYSGFIPVHKGIPDIGQYLTFLVFVVIIWSIVYKAMSSNALLSNRSAVDDFCEIIKLSSVSLLLLIATTFFYREHSYSRTVMVLFWGICSVLVYLSHFISKKVIINLRKKGFNIRKILIVGAGELGQGLAMRIKKHEELGIEILGFLTDHYEKKGSFINGIKILDHLDKTKEVVEKVRPDELYIALPLGAHKRLEKVLATLIDETVDIRIVPDLYKFMKLNGGVEVFEGLPIIKISEGPLWGWNRFIKRLLDILFSVFAIVLFTPVMLFVTLLVKITSKGPLLYKQERMGLGGKRFVMCKFRSMVVDAEDKSGAVWAVKDDARTTSLGRWLRKTSLDELPQFFNVLSGTMSFVGPRPERPVFVKEFRRSVPLYMLRHKMKAGITGWAQVNGWRGNTSLEKRIEYDLYYIENWSLFFDFKIMFMTVWKGFVGKNAY